MMYAIVEGDRAWLHKMTYNEDYAKFSTGHPRGAVGH